MAISTLGRTVRRQREALGLTREQLAGRASVSTSLIARLELNGHTPKTEAILRIAAALEMTPATLIEGLAS